MDRWKQCTHRLSDQQEQDGRLHLIPRVHKSVLEGMFIHVVELLHWEPFVRSTGWS